MNNLFIAPKIKVGFQKREDTFTGQLAYVIYYDLKGILRKEQSWNSWRDKEIAAQEFDNAPTEGFTINKDIKRYSGEWFSSRRTMIRVHDPRGFEVEVSTENLIAILMHTDCLRRGLIGQFVYAWMGKELVLLPTNSEEYQKATQFTQGLSKNVKSKELIPGVSYKTKREGDVIFLGKLNWFDYPEINRYTKGGERRVRKVNVFIRKGSYDKDKNEFFHVKSLEFLSTPNSDVPVSNFAELMDEFNTKLFAHKIDKFEFVPTSFKTETTKDQWGRDALVRNKYFTKEGNAFAVRCITIEYDRNAKLEDELRFNFERYGYGGDKSINQEGFIKNNQEHRNYYKNTCYYRPTEKPGYSQEEINKIELFDLIITLDNGEKRQINDIYELN